MNGKINTDQNPKSNFSPGFFKLIIIVSLLVIALFALSTIFNFNAKHHINGTFIPWVGAGSITVLEGIDEFSGKEGSRSFIEEKLFAAAGLLIGFIIGPTLLMFGLRSFRNGKNNKNDSPGNKKFRPGIIIMFIGAAITLYPVGMGAISSIISPGKFSRMKNIALTQKTKDDLLFNMGLLAYDAMEIAILPESMNGGNGTFKTEAGVRMIRLNDLKSYKKTEIFSYYIAPFESDTIMTFIGVADIPGDEESFSNYNGNNGKIQATLKIRPAAVIKTKIDN